MKVAAFAFETPNLGDDLQVLAASVHLRHIDTLIDRDRIMELEFSEPHLVVMNSWFQLARRFANFAWKKPLRPPSDSFRPLFHGFCVGRDKVLNASWTEYLARHQPIGARDRVSVERLAARSIDAYWAGCLTAFIGRAFEPIPRAERRGILIADVPDPVAEFYLPKSLRDRCERITTFPAESIKTDSLARMHRIAAICDQLRRAEFVITRRLHVALPCVSFGTPVVVIAKAEPNTTRRFSGFDEFLPIVWYTDQLAPGEIDWDQREPARIPDELENRFQSFLERLKSTVGNADSSILHASVAASSEVRLENPGLSGTSGEIAIDLGRGRVNRTASLWTRQEIRFRLDHFASFPRFRTPVYARATGDREWVALGPACEVMRHARPLTS